jgi:hypothetical protein
MGHGRFDVAESIGYVALLDDERAEARWIPDRLLVEMFQQVRALPRLVVLHLCEGAAVDFTADFSGVAPRLIRAEIQGVVGMQYPISNGAAGTFSRSFYRRLAEQSDVDDAVQQARSDLTFHGTDGHDKRDFGIPVLYMRSRDAVLHGPAEPVVATNSGP